MDKLMGSRPDIARTASFERILRSIPRTIRLLLRVSLIVLLVAFLVLVVYNNFLR